MRFAPTSQQRAIMDAFTTGSNLVVEAGAGTGKTATLTLAAQQRPEASGLYLAFNRAIADEAKAKFGPNTDCRTAHSIAYQTVGKRYRGRLNGPRQPAREVANSLGIREPLDLGDHVRLSPTQQARLALDTVRRFCYSAGRELLPNQVPQLEGITDQQQQTIVQVVLPHAKTVWTDLQQVSGGRFRFEHDHYLKIWALTRPTLEADFVLFDEAQDANPVVADVVQSQRNAQLVAVGDRSQSIYGWRGATDAMQRWPAEQRLYLSESFRFGPQIAAEANKWLTLLDTRLRLTGCAQDGQIGPLGNWPDAVLCRTNAGAVNAAMNGLAAGRRTALVGGGKPIRDLAAAAIDLQDGRATSHPELVAFPTWADVQDHVTYDAAGADLRAFVNLIDKHGADVVIDTVEQLVPEAPDRGHRDRFTPPELVVSTAHKAKGREWGAVQIGTDFEEPADADDGKPGPVPDADAMLAYVSVTRAQQRLDPGGLSWIDQRPELNHNTADREVAM